MQNFCYNTPCSAGVAHPVERHLAKVEVASSSLVTRSIKKSPLPDGKGDFFNDIRSLRNRRYIFAMISHYRAMIYAFDMRLNGYYIIFAKQIYHAACAVYHIANGDISLKNVYVRDKIKCVEVF